MTAGQRIFKIENYIKNKLEGLEGTARVFMLAYLNNEFVPSLPSALSSYAHHVVLKLTEDPSWTYQK